MPKDGPLYPQVRDLNHNRSEARLTIPDRIVAVLLLALALPSAPLLYLDGRLGWAGIPVLCGALVFWFIVVVGFWFVLGAGAARYRGCRAKAFLGRLAWWGMALMLCYLPFVFGLPELGCLHRLESAFTPEVIAAVRAASLRELARQPEGPVSKSGIPDTYFHDLPEDAVSALEKAGINRWDLRRSDDPLVWQAVLWESSHIRGTGISIPGRIPDDFPVPGTDISSPDDPDRGRSITWHAGSTLFYHDGD